MKNTLINGLPADYLNINDRSIHYGDGLFETILCCNNHLYFWQQHFQRLQFSAKKLKLACPDEKLLLKDIRELLEKNENSANNNYVVKIIISRGNSERGYHFANKSEQTRIVILSAIETNYSSILSRELLSGDLYICEQQVSINKNLAGLKHLNRLENVLARNEWNTGYIDGLMLNNNQHVIEGTMSNLFAVKNNQLYTPDLELSGVNGIMREIIIDLASKSNINTSVVDLTINDLSTMNELFISNSLIGIKSINKLCDWTYSKHNVTKNIFSELLKTKENHVQVV